MPPLQVNLFRALLVVILYTLVPEGRWRNTGKWVAVGLVVLTALGRVALVPRRRPMCWSRWPSG
jgi:hypothetical protein